MLAGQPGEVLDRAPEGLELGALQCPRQPSRPSTSVGLDRAVADADPERGGHLDERLDASMPRSHSTTAHARPRRRATAVRSLPGERSSAPSGTYTVTAEGACTAPQVNTWRRRDRLEPAG